MPRSRSHAGGAGRRIWQPLGEPRVEVINYLDACFVNIDCLTCGAMVHVFTFILHDYTRAWYAPYGVSPKWMISRETLCHPVLLLGGDPDQEPDYEYFPTTNKWKRPKRQKPHK